MKVLLSQVAEPQICFPVDDGGVICNWVKRGLYAISSKNGWMKIPPGSLAEIGKIEEDEEEVKKKEKIPGSSKVGISSAV